MQKGIFYFSALEFYFCVVMLGLKNVNLVSLSL